MSNDVLQKWSFVAEILGGVAILITLLFIIIEIRENTETTKRSNFEGLQQDLRAWRAGLLRNERILDVYQRGIIQQEELSDPLSQTLLNQYYVNLISIYESAYYFYQAGDLGEEEWLRYESRICGDVNSRWEHSRNFLTQEFVGYTDQCRGYIASQ